MTAKRRLQIKRKAAHLCIDCGKPAHVGIHCDPCRNAHNDRRQTEFTLRRLKELMDARKIEPLTVLAMASHFAGVPYPPLR